MERTRRARKVVNYAELNDVYLPPLGPSDFIASGGQPSLARPSGETVTRSVGTRASRRLRDQSGGMEEQQHPVDIPGQALNSVHDLANSPLPLSPRISETDEGTQNASSVGVDVEKQGEEFSSRLDSPNSDQHTSSLADGPITRVLPKVLPQTDTREDSCVTLTSPTKAKDFYCSSGAPVDSDFSIGRAPACNGSTTVSESPDVNCQ